VIHDLNVFSLVHDEIAQQRTTGHDVTEAARTFAATDQNDISALETLLASLDDLPRPEDWPYEEPESLDDILESLPASAGGTVRTALSGIDLDDKIRGGWSGRVAGCNVGKPLENPAVWTTDRIRTYLELADAWPLLDYVPVIDPLPAEYRFQDCWVDTTKGNVDGSDRDDDIDYSILGLYLLEQQGRGLTSRHVADGWLAMLPFHRVYTAERAVYKNLVGGIPPERAASVRNPYREWIGALIRGDVFGWVSPGDPVAAMSLAYQDASMSHVTNGIYGELWSGALLASAFSAANAREAVEASLNFVPPRSRLAETLRSVVRSHTDGRSWSEAIASIQDAYGHYDPIHTINNAAIIAAGLLWGADDFAATVGLTVSGGWDTDSNGATAGSVSGVLLGASRLPDHLIEPLHDRTRSAVFGFDNSSISDLAKRTIRLAKVFDQDS
jgi:ADP-ribosylglycohydrolase